MFVRDLSPEEAQRLRRVSRQSKVFGLRQRAQILWRRTPGWLLGDRSGVADRREPGPPGHPEFNLDGMARCALVWGAGGRGGSMTPTREPIRPSPWPVPAISVNLAPAGRCPLRRYLVRHRVVRPISKEHLRRVLSTMGITASGPVPGNDPTIRCSS